MTQIERKLWELEEQIRSATRRANDAIHDANEAWDNVSERAKETIDTLRGAGDDIPLQLYILQHFLKDDPYKDEIQKIITDSNPWSFPDGAVVKFRQVHREQAQALNDLYRLPIVILGPEIGASWYEHQHRWAIRHNLPREATKYVPDEPKSWETIRTHLPELLNLMTLARWGELG